jgi:hypothetical protein
MARVLEELRAGLDGQSGGHSGHYYILSEDTSRFVLQWSGGAGIDAGAVSAVSACGQALSQTRTFLLADKLLPEPGLAERRWALGGAGLVGHPHYQGRSSLPLS